MYRLPVAALVAVSLFSEAPTQDKILQEAIRLHQAGDLNGAIGEYRAFLKLVPSAFEARSNLGAALSKQGRYEEAITEYKLALPAKPNSPAILLNLALAHYKSGQFPQAVSEVQTLHSRLPANQQARFF